MGLHPGDGKDVRVHHGVPHLRAHRRVVVVPLCLRVPDAAALQPGLQPGAADLEDPCRAEWERHEARLMRLRNDHISLRECHPRRYYVHSMCSIKQ